MPLKLTPAMKARIRKRAGQGITGRQIAAELGISPTTVGKALKEATGERGIRGKTRHLAPEVPPAPPPPTPQELWRARWQELAAAVDDAETPEARSRAATQLMVHEHPELGRWLERSELVVDALGDAGLDGPLWLLCSPQEIAKLAILLCEFPGHGDDAEPGEGERERERAVALLEAAAAIVRAAPIASRWRAAS